MPKQEYKCHRCGGITLRHPSTVAKTVYCSVKCSTEAAAEKRKAPVLIKKECKNCGKEFETTRQEATYCTITCSREIKKKTPKTQVCEVCGKDFTPQTKGRKYCSRPCYAEGARFVFRDWSN